MPYADEPVQTAMHANLGTRRNPATQHRRMIRDQEWCWRMRYCNVALRTDDLAWYT